MKLLVLLTRTSNLRNVSDIVDTCNRGTGFTAMQEKKTDSFLFTNLKKKINISSADMSVGPKGHREFAQSFAGLCIDGREVNRLQGLENTCKYNEDTHERQKWIYDVCMQSFAITCKS